MAANKHISKIIIAVMAVAAVCCILATAFSEKLSAMMGGTGVSMEYETKLFDTDEVIDINIRMDEEEWDEMLANALTEEYYVCDVTINGETIHDVAIRPKGNTSLSSIAMDPDTDRFSLKLEFGHFVDGQTCYGLDKLILNNNYADATNMKEAVIYDMYQYIGADASLYNYAKVSLNGEYRGVYLALEGVESSFMLRNFGTQDGELYKPDSMEMGGGKNSSSSSKSSGGFPGGDFKPGNMPERDGFDPSNMPEMGDFDPSNMPEMGDFDPSNMPDMSDFDPNNMPDMGGFEPKTEDATKDAQTTDENTADAKTSDAGAADDGSSEKDSKRPSGGFPGGFSMGGGGANLNYTDDELDSYSTIWDGEITGTSKADHRRVVTALKNISEGTDLEKYLDVDNILKYMAVHAFSVNMDSLSGSMAHNYYLYEYDGQLNIFPWDYNLSLGGMSMGSSGDATSIVNDAIDTPFAGTNFFDALLENEEYLAKYHEYLQHLVDEYIDGGRFEVVYNRIRSQIDELVETDPTAFYNYDEYQTAADLLYQTILLRAESVKGQLDGSIPSTDEGQKADSSALVDASGIDVKAMGQMNMGGGGGEDRDGDGDDDSSFNGIKENKRRPAFAQMSEPGLNQEKIKNLILLGICLAVMLIGLGVAKAVSGRARRYRRGANCKNP